MNIDKKMFFAEIAYKYGKIGVYSENSKRILGFHFVNMKFAVIILSFLTRICDEKSSIKLISELFEAGSDRQENFNISYQPSMLIICDTYIYLCLLFEGKALSSEMINKIVKEGFTKYNHDMLINMWNELYPSGRKFVPVEIQYSATERGLEFETEGFMFCLPDNTEKLIDIGAKMNICVGHLYREKAVKKSCTIVYVEKDHEYVMCIELTNNENQFSIVQASDFSNQKVRGKNLEVLKEWIKEKKIKMGI